jgi:hypothetical protein
MDSASIERRAMEIFLNYLSRPTCRLRNPTRQLFHVELRGMDIVQRKNVTDRTVSSDWGKVRKSRWRFIP